MRIKSLKKRYEEMVNEFRIELNELVGKENCRVGRGELGIITLCLMKDNYELYLKGRIDQVILNIEHIIEQRDINSLERFCVGVGHGELIKLDEEGEYNIIFEF